MKTTTHIFISFALLFALSLTSGCRTTYTPEEQVEKDLQYFVLHLTAYIDRHVSSGQFYVSTDTWILQVSTEEFETWKRFADGGNSHAQTLIGLSYLYGDEVVNNRVPKDYDEAAKWFRKAAELGNPTAQSQLGSCYFHGLGVSQDTDEGVKWFRKAAEQKDAVAQAVLYRCYRDGMGVPQDQTEADRWFELAKEQMYKANAKLAPTSPRVVERWLYNTTATFLRHTFWSLYATFFYLGMILFVFFQEIYVEKGRAGRSFSFSSLYSGSLVLFCVFFFVFMYVGSDFSQDFANGTWFSRLIKIAAGNPEYDALLAGFNALAVLICYFCVSRPPGGGDGGSGLDAFFGRELNREERYNVTVYNQWSSGYREKIHEYNTTENPGCVTVPMTLIFGTFLSPVVVCFKFLLNNVMPFLPYLIVWITSKRRMRDADFQADEQTSETEKTSEPPSVDGETDNP